MPNYPSVTGNSGAGQRPYIQTFEPNNTGSGNATVTANAAFLVAVGRLAAPVKITSFKLSINVAAGNIDVALMQMNADGSYTRLVSTGSVAVGGTGIQTFTPATPYWAPAGVDLALCAVPDNATLSWLRINASVITMAALSLQVQSKTAVNIPIPATISSTGNSTAIPYIWAG